VNPIADCQASCPKGNGTAEDNQNYNDCVTDCIATAQVTIVSSTATFAQSETSTPSE
jgi:squalene cyclase